MCRTRWPRSCGRVWRRIPRSGPARCNCHCGSRRSPPGRHRDSPTRVRPRPARLRPTGPRGGSPTPTRSSSANSAGPRARTGLRRRGVPPPGHAGPRRSGAGLLPRGAEAPPQWSGSVPALWVTADACLAAHDTLGQREPARAAQRYRSSGAQDHGDGAQAGQSSAAAATAVRLRRRHTARGSRHRRRPGLSGAGAGAGR